MTIFILKINVAFLSIINTVSYHLGGKNADWRYNLLNKRFDALRKIESIQAKKAYKAFKANPNNEDIFPF